MSKCRVVYLRLCNIWRCGVGISVRCVCAGRVNHNVTMALGIELSTAYLGEYSSPFLDIILHLIQLMHFFAGIHYTQCSQRISGVD